MFCSYICNIVILIHWFWQFFGTSLSFLHRWICHLWIKNYYFSFHIWWHFLCFSCLITLAKASSTTLDRNDECRHLCPIVSFSWKVFTLLPLSMLLTVGFFFSSITSFLAVFIRIDIEFCQKFFWIYWKVIGFFLILLIQLITLIDFSNARMNLHSLNKSHGFMICYLFYHWFPCLKILFSVLHLCW